MQSQSFPQSSPPTILSYTPGQVWDDDGGFDNTIQIAAQDNGTLIVATGTLTRIVTAVLNADGADIRQITFRLDYSYGGRSQSISCTRRRLASMSALRASRREPIFAGGLDA